jgi:hypothetical protein
MQCEPIQFGALTASRAERSAAGFTLPSRGARKTASDTNTVSVLDAAFADFIRVDAGSPTSMAISKPLPKNSPTITQALIADIATQLESLDSQRRQLARLLEGVNSNATV